MMYFVEIVHDGLTRAAFGCKTLPEAKRTFYAVQELCVGSGERVRVVKEIEV